MGEIVCWTGESALCFSCWTGEGGDNAGCGEEDEGRVLSWSILNISVLCFVGGEVRIFVEKRMDEGIRML
jgi:hypothetical protein